MWVNKSKSVQVCRETNLCIVKDNIIGFLVYLNYEYYLKDGRDYVSFESLKKAKQFCKVGVCKH